ncbi:uncharacterized protein IUM83_14427 [Phytophthora cinnamomi]|uniref:uncharacterized protein n=1 Tax=Phytophthora cinnamomi TaxID=4785 RepID=UPI00355A0B99|nr:hypothetical protein IUM83_14427 [Phytophthora cinnamomi]
MTSAYQYRANNESLFALAKVMEVTCEEADCVEWCKEVGLIDKTKFCPLCSMPMRLSCELKRWRCCRSTQHATGKEVNLGMLTNSFFSETKLNLCSAVRLLLAWFMRLAHGQTSELADVSERAVHNWDSGKPGSSATSNTCAA